MLNATTGLEALWTRPSWGACLLIASLIVASGNARAADKKADECGLASIYSGVSEETASGENTRPENLTAAHPSLPFGARVRVNNQENGRSAVVRITDRGPFTDERIVDVSQAAAHQLGFSGLAQVCLTILMTPEVNPWGETDCGISEGAPSILRCPKKADQEIRDLSPTLFPGLAYEEEFRR